jgi:TPR repeat protein
MWKKEIGQIQMATKALQMWTGSEEFECDQEEALKLMIAFAYDHQDLQAIITASRWSWELSEHKLEDENQNNHYKETTFQLLEKAAKEHGHSESAILLAKLTVDDNDDSLSIYYWTLAAKTNSPQAIIFLSHYLQSKYLHDEMDNNFELDVFELSRQACLLKDEQSLRFMADNTCDQEESLDLYKEAAKCGDVSSYIIIANILYNGTTEVERNIDSALEYYIMAARLAMMNPSLTQIANCYKYGDSDVGLKSDPERAFELFIII